MKSNNIIELNGKLYDARTGSPLESKVNHKNTPHHTQKPAVKKQPSRTVKSIDGFSPRRAGSASTIKPVLKPQVVEKKPAQVPAVRKSNVNRSANTSIKRSVKRSSTLNRAVVKAPNFTTSTPVDTPQKPEETVSSGALKHADSLRMDRAKHINKSGAISKFGTSTPTLSKTSEKKPSLTEHLQSTHAKLVEPAVSEPHQKNLLTKERLIKKAIDSAIASNPVQAANNKTHVKTSKRSKSKSRAGFATTALAALVLVGYVAYLNVPSISIKVAAHRAGFAAQLPAYKPAGYSLKGPIAYSPGQVTLNFASNTDQRKFTLKQQPTTWDSTALLENFVTKKGSNYLTYQDSGLTIYILDGTSAAWVSGGKLYQVEGKNSQLDTDQLLRLATSV